ncbi:MFS transporter [Actinomadura rupiterrae]|uniref:MFS transporter n=1 Tax=Actinomadura rupiterrae TaxID=559627 RepID=UPI0020A27DA3|nr:MFS transporter [Actinomadura rupiterrae]MCP2337103.1 EmrB/QacA subfamily drug resistance transporter [Actinomadura rupiterrae]
MSTTTAEPAAREMPKGRELAVVLGALMLSMLLAALDQTIVATALPTIVGDLGGLNHLSWVVTAYLLSSTACTPLWGKLGDQYGRKRLFQASIVIFLAGSALCGVAGSMGQLIAFRAIQGVGGGGLMVLAIAIVGDVVPPRERGRYQGLFGAVFGVSSVCGPLLGGWFVDNLSWHWVFYINLPIGLLALAAIAFALHTRPVRHKHRIDYLGTLLIIGWATALVLMTTWGGTEYDWVSPQIIGLGVLAVVLIVLWVYAEHRAAEPIIPLRLFRDSTFDLSSAIGFVVGFAMFGAMTYLPLFLQVVHGVSPTMSGVYLLPMMLGLLVASIGSGQLISKNGRYRIYPMIGTPIVALALFLLSRMGVGSSTLSMSLRFALLGFGLGLVMQVLVIAVQNRVDYADLGVATSAVTFFRQIGGSFGVAAFGTVFANRLAGNITDLAKKGELRGGFNPAAVQGNPKLLDKLPPNVHLDLLHAYSDAISKVFLYAVPVALVACVLTWFMKETPLRSGAGAVDAVQPLGDGSSRTEAERALSELIRNDPSALELYGRLAQAAGVSLPPEQMWALCRIAKDGSVRGEDLAERAGVTVEEGRPHVRGLVEDGLVTSDGTTLAPTERGTEVAERLVRARRAGLARQISDWSPDENPELADVLTRLTRATLGDDAEGRAVHGRGRHRAERSGRR